MTGTASFTAASAPLKVPSASSATLLPAEALRLWSSSARVKPTVLQNRFYADTGYDVALRAFCAERQVRYQSFWTLTANPRVLASRTLQEIAARHGMTAEQMFLRCVSQLGIVPLVGTTSEVHMRQDLDLFDAALTPSEVSAVQALLASG